MKAGIRAGTAAESKVFEKARKPACQRKVDFGAKIDVKHSPARITRHDQLKDLIGKQALAVVNFFRGR